MMAEIYNAFKGQSSSAPSGSVPSVPATLAIIAALSIVEGENVTHITIEKPPSHTEGEHDDTKVDKEKTRNDKAEEEPARRTTHIPLSAFRSLMRPNLDLERIRTTSTIKLTDTILEMPPPQQQAQVTGPVIDITPPEVQPTGSIISIPRCETSQVTHQFPFEIHEKLYHLTNDETQEHLNKEEMIKKAAKEAKLLEMSKLELIKVVHEEAEKAGIDPKILASAKGGKEFKNNQDAEIKVHQREHS
ncbi:hypothetical protein Tco_0368155 [Tanacetum coccineum]